MSPKTKVVPRTASQGSHYSMSQESLSARNSWSAAHSAHERNPPLPSHSSLDHAYLRSSADTSGPPAASPIIPNSHTASATPHAPHAQSPLLRNSSQTSQMRNLLNGRDLSTPPTMKTSPAPNPATSSQPQYPSPQQSRPISETAAAAAAAAARTRTTSDGAVLKTEPLRIKPEPPADLIQDSLLQQPISNPAPKNPVQPAMPQKRPAETEPEAAQLQKRAKRRYVEPPIWARYVESNPRWGNNPQSMAPLPQPQRPVKKLDAHIRTSVTPAANVAPPNGYAPPHAPGTPNGAPPSTIGPGDASPAQIHPRLGKWESNIRNEILPNDFTRQVGEFLYHHATRDDVGDGDARNGVLEIEAKLGTLINRDTDQRVSTMAFTNVILAPGVTESGRIRFESFMDEVSRRRCRCIPPHLLTRTASVCIGPTPTSQQLAQCMPTRLPPPQSRQNGLQTPLRTRHLRRPEPRRLRGPAPVRQSASETAPLAQAPHHRRC